MDEGHRRSRNRCDDERRGQRHATGCIEALDGPESHHRADEHHALDPEIDDPGTLGEELSQRGEYEGRPVEHRGRDDDHDEALVDPAREDLAGHELASTAASGTTGVTVRPKRIR